MCIDTACPFVSLFLLVILYLALSSYFDKQMMPKLFVVEGVRDDDEQLGGVVILDFRFFFSLPSFRPAVIIISGSKRGESDITNEFAYG